MPTRLGRRPALDGLRAIAVLLVMLAHSGGRSPFHQGGRIGVAMFFTLSGFLITALLIDERRDTARVHFGAFYGRRALRLLPALALLVVAVGIYAATVAGPTEHAASGILPALLYLANWFTATGHDLGPLQHTWTLSIEEQFYVLWPLAFAAIARCRRPAAIVAGLFVAFTAWRFVLWVVADQNRLDGTDAHAATILAGCVLAFVWTKVRAPSWLGALGLAVLVGLSLVPRSVSAWLLDVWAPILIAAAAVVAIAAALDRDGWYVRALATPAARYVGRISYGLYLWHAPIFFAFAFHQGSLASEWKRVLLSWCLAFVVAAASHHFIERPLIEGPLGQRLRAVVRRDGAAPDPMPAIS